jgi:hypothetical protein
MLTQQISMVFDKKGKPRGYAFIEFEHERDMQSELLLLLYIADSFPQLHSERPMESKSRTVVLSSM